MLSVPTNTTARVLHTLLLKKKVSIEDFPIMSGFRTRISELRLDYNVKLIHIFKKGKNMFGNTIYYKVHFLPDEEVNNAIEAYKKINTKKIKSNQN